LGGYSTINTLSPSASKSGGVLTTTPISTGNRYSASSTYSIFFNTSTPKVFDPPSPTLLAENFSDFFKRGDAAKMGVLTGTDFWLGVGSSLVFFSMLFLFVWRRLQYLSNSRAITMKDELGLEPGPDTRYHARMMKKSSGKKRGREWTVSNPLIDRV